LPAGPPRALGRAAVLHRRLGAYDAALPSGRHYIGKDQTQRSESNNARQRHWFARFRRRTCVVSKSLEMVEATMALFAYYHCNGGSLTSALVR
jgi:insertion element IS1 protein InsB